MKRILLAFLLVGCSPKAPDCAKACDHVMACQGKYDDADLSITDRQHCLADCDSRTALNHEFDASKKGTDSYAWSCATDSADCSELDHGCDVY